MQIIDLYLFQTVTMPIYIWHHTSATSAYVYDQETYSPLAMGRGNVLSTDELQKNVLAVSVPLDSEIAKLCLAQEQPKSLFLTLYRSINGTVSKWFKGSLSTVECSGGIAKLNFINDFSKLKTQGVRTLASRNCPHSLYDAACGVNFDNFAVASEVVYKSGKSLVVNLTSPLPSPTYFEGGFVKFGNYKSAVVSASNGTLELSRDIPGLEVGNTLTVYPGCDKKINTCVGTFNNAYFFGGLPALTIDNPFSSSDAL